MTDEAKALVERLRDYGDREDYEVHHDRIEAADLIETQAREIKRLTTQNAALYDAYYSKTHHLSYAVIKEKNERLREALQFYAREYNWRSCGVYMCGHSNPSSAEIDRGDKARAALGESHD